MAGMVGKYEVRATLGAARAAFKRRVVRDEGPGILAWAVVGFMAWKAIGLDEPLAVRAASKAWRGSQMDAAAIYRQGRQR